MNVYKNYMHMHAMKITTIDYNINSMLSFGIADRVLVLSKGKLRFRRKQTTRANGVSKILLSNLCDMTLLTKNEFMHDFKKRIPLNTNNFVCITEPIQYFP